MIADTRNLDKNPRLTQSSILLEAIHTVAISKRQNLNANYMPST
jgi:hypothetical protein